MARLSLDSHLIERNPPIEVEFAGLRSDTFTMGRCGWRMAIEEADHYRDERMLILFHEATGLTLMGRFVMPLLAQHYHAHIGSQFSLDGRDGRIPPPVVRLQQCAIRGMGKGVQINIHGAIRNLRWMETSPTMIEIERRDLYSLPIFAELNEPAGEQLIVEPATVSELLDQIRRMQVPEQEAIRARNRDRDRRNAHRLHAQILSAA